MKVYRIYTEDKNFKRVVQETSSRVTGATFLHGVGLYNREQEKSLVIEIMSTPDTETTLENTVRGLAYAIKVLNWQWSVLVTVQEVQSWAI